MKKSVIWIMMVLGIMCLLAACGEKSQESVTTDLEKMISDMDGYKANAEMIMHTGQDEQVYHIEIWHKKADFYRVSLNNDHDDEGQVILKNEDGVYVLTPSLNKSFKFQTEWPDNSSQPYLFESLVNDIVQDQDAEFEATEEQYIYRTKTNYQSNRNLPFQEIYFDKKTLTPLLVKILDVDKKSVVEVNFASFDMNPTFGEDDFKITEEDLASSEDTATSASVASDFPIVYPLYTAGSELVEQKEIKLDHGQRVIMTFSGEKNFTLVQETADVVESFAPQEVKGDIVNLGHSLGVLTPYGIEWSLNGVDYYLASEELTREELIEVAQSVQGREVK